LPTDEKFRKAHGSFDSEPSTQPLSWPSGSPIVDHDYPILARANLGPDETIVVADIDLDALPAARQAWWPHNPRR